MILLDKNVWRVYNTDRKVQQMDTQLKSLFAAVRLARWEKKRNEEYLKPFNELNKIGDEILRPIAKMKESVSHGNPDIHASLLDFYGNHEYRIIISRLIGREDVVNEIALITVNLARPWYMVISVRIGGITRIFPLSKASMVEHLIRGHKIFKA